MRTGTLYFRAKKPDHQESLHVERLTMVTIRWGESLSYAVRMDRYSRGRLVDEFDRAARLGTAFTVLASISTSAGGDARAIMIGDAAPGGSPDRRTIQFRDHVRHAGINDNCYNACAFANPLPGNLIAPLE